VDPKRIGAIRPAGHRDPRAGTDQDEFVAETPRLGGCPAPPLQLQRKGGFEHAVHRINARTRSGIQVLSGSLIENVVWSDPANLSRPRTAAAPHRGLLRRPF
jgi:hypothetical protein